MRPFTVVGYWEHTQERYVELHEAYSARGAEDAARIDAAARGLTLHVAGVLDGAVVSCDADYAMYVDPRDVRNADEPELSEPLPGLELAEYTVLGLAVDPHDEKWDRRTGGQRYCNYEWADSALAAEDAATCRIRDEGGRLLVCAVYEGRVQRADAVYAQFSNPDVAAG